MSYVRKMKDLIELYLAELERDGFDNSCGIPLPDAKELLLDFAQWLEDDVQDLEPVTESIEVQFESEVLQPDSSILLIGCRLVEDETPNITGFGDIVEGFLTDEEGAGFLELIPKPGFYKCLKTVIMNEGFEDEFQHQAFTAGKFYGGRLGATPGGDYTIIFKNDTGMDHHAHGAWLYEHFEFAAEYNPD